jgi:hypothetical protein
MVLSENERIENMRERCARRKKKGGGDWESCEERGERPSFFWIIITCWEATVLPNVLGSTVASQASP